MLNKLLRLLIPVQYTDLDPSIKGRSWGLFIQIDNRFKNDLGLLAHERVHVKQLFRIWSIFIILGILIGYFVNLNLGLVIGILGYTIHGFLYTYNKLYKYKCEVEAFGYSVLYGNRTKENVKYSLKNFYKIPNDILDNFDNDFEKSMNNASKDLSELTKL